MLLHKVGDGVELNESTHGAVAEVQSEVALLSADGCVAGQASEARHAHVGTHFAQHLGMAW